MGQEKSFKLENGLFVKQNAEFLQDVDITGALNVGGSASFSDTVDFSSASVVGLGSSESGSSDTDNMPDIFLMMGG